MVSTRPRAQNAEAILSVMVGCALDKPRIIAFPKRLPFEAGGRPFSLRGPPVTELSHRAKIHENTLILTGRALKQLFEFSTVV
jgi:hypothetical protein